MKTALDRSGDAQNPSSKLFLPFFFEVHIMGNLILKGFPILHAARTANLQVPDPKTGFITFSETLRRSSLGSEKHQASSHHLSMWDQLVVYNSHICSNGNIDSQLTCC